MSFQTKPGYTADTQANVTAQVPDTEDGAIAYAVAEQTAWQLSKTSAATVGSDVLATKSGTGRWLKIAYGSQTNGQLMELSGQAGDGAGGSFLAVIQPRFDLTWGNLYLPLGIEDPIRAIRFYWAGGVGAQKIRCRLYEWNAAGFVAEETVVVDADGVYTATFASPYLPTGLAARQYLYAGCYNLTTNTTYTAIASTTYSPNQFPPYPYGRRMFFLGSVFVAGEGKPVNNPLSERYLVDLVY